MRDHTSTCISSGVAYILSNWYYDEEDAAEEMAADVCNEVETFVDMVSDFMPMEDYAVDISVADDGSSFDLSVRYQPISDSNEKFTIHFVVTISGNKGSVIVSA